MTVGQQGTQLSTIICFRKFIPYNACRLSLTSAMNGRIIYGQEGTSIMANSWTRCASNIRPVSLLNTASDRINSADVVHEYGRRMYNLNASHWLTQANDIFNRLDMIWGLEDFGIFLVSPSTTSITHLPSLSTCYRLLARAFEPDR
jgi:hypothetical protein